MFISSRHKLVFLEVPRTASRSVTNALTEFDPYAPSALARRSWGTSFAYHNFRVRSELVDDYLVVAAHRNPYCRLWSYWKHRRSSGNPKIFKTTSWERYVDWVCDPASVPEIKGAMLDLPISEMFDCKMVDFWLRFETLDRSWTELQERFNLDFPPLRHNNASQPIEIFREAFDAVLAEKVACRFSADFDRFGYARDSWKCMT